MAQVKLKELRDLSSDELLRREKDLANEALQMRLQLSTGQLEDTDRLKINRRELARVKTIIAENARAAAQQ